MAASDAVSRGLAGCIGGLYSKISVLELAAMSRNSPPCFTEPILASSLPGADFGNFFSASSSWRSSWACDFDLPELM